MVRAITLFGAATLLVGAGTAMAGPPAQVPAADIVFLDEVGQPRPGVRCAAPGLSMREKARVAAAVARLNRKGGVPGPPEPTATPTPGGDPEPTPGVGIPVYFHVIYAKGRGGIEEGNVPQSQIDTQMDVLNAAFASSGFQFYLAGVDRTENKQWFTGCYGAAEDPMKQALAVNPATTLNIYTCEPRNGILGYAYLPSSLPEDHYIHGVVVLHSSLPGGTAAPYNLGDTVTHEVGHYLGLYHTFDGGCSLPGDYIDDTAPEASPAFGCPAGRDTCSGGGPDPIYNFMDYTDDDCMDHFTGGQASWMTAIVKQYKPTLAGLLGLP